MIYDECELGMKVCIMMPENTVLHQETGTIAAINGADEILIRFDVYKPKFDQFEDARRGSVIVGVENLHRINDL